MTVLPVSERDNDLVVMVLLLHSAAACGGVIEGKGQERRVDAACIFDMYRIVSGVVALSPHLVLLVDKLSREIWARIVTNRTGPRDVIPTVKK